MRTEALLGFWVMVIDTIRRDGWVSKRTAEASRDKRPTVATVCQRLLDKDRPDPTCADEAARVYDWARALTGPDSYRAKIGQLARGEREFTDSELAFAASIPEAFTRDRAQAARAAGPARSRHVGRIGQRTEFAVKVERVIDLEGAYGAAWLHVMRDASGNRYTWKCTSYANRLTVGETYTVRATVKAHREYRGECETSLTRAAKVGS